jgi:hypothetical protein
MSSEPKIYHGEWWVPAEADPNRSMFMTAHAGHEKHHTGTLTYYEDDDSILELYHIPSDIHATHYGYNQVIWGITANGMVFTLFNVVMEKNFSGDFTKTKFTVGLILVGEHLISMRKPHYNRCIVQFPYLRNWAFHDNLVNTQKEGLQNQTILDIRNMVTLAEANVANGIKWVLHDKISCNRSVYDLSINQLTEFVIETSNAISVDAFLKHIGEFSQFLSIALYCEQNPIEIKLYGTEQNPSVQLLYKIDRSIDPKANKLIDFDALKEKVSTMLLIWHQNYDKIAPISSYLVDSLQKKKTFGVPDFLIIAQALDGYHKRFVNKSKGKDKRKYDEQIEVLLNQFDDVEVIQRCHIDPKVLRDTRHKYSHLFPDDEKSLAVDGDELYWLTEKCKILLTCCILNMIGLSNAEINLCCENSPIAKMIKSNPFEFE